MKNICLVITLFLSLSQYSLAETPVRIDKKDFNTHSAWTEANLDAWFSDNNRVGRFGGTEDGVCEMTAPPYYNVIVTSNAYGSKGSYGVIIDDGISDIYKIESAKVGIFKSNVLYIQMQDGRMLTCVK